ncbi:VanZ family protein [Alkalihalobacterium sp. APHAB7]|uniref:VanZ family protein n=1 Tax=Alkalihalobacterium sp. APHAB7 TaxID=3402081 RepID=UPI003AAABF68
MYVINVVSIGIVIIVFYFVIDLIRDRKKHMVSRLIFLSFLFYAFNVLQQVTGGINFPPVDENFWSWKWNTQFIPFYFVGDLISHYNTSGVDWFFWNSVKLSFYNVLLLFPLGVYLSFYKFGSIKRAALIILIVSLALETLQLVFSYFGLIFSRSFNVDDLILNTVGGVLGYFVFDQLKKLYSRTFSKKQNEKSLNIS